MAEYRRRLLHIHPDGEHLFVSWRLHGSLPVAPPDIIYSTPGHAFAAQDRALAQSHGTVWLSDSRVARQVVQAIRDGERQRRFYQSKAWVVMPNHVHLLILPQVSLAQITHWIKGRTARESNRLLGRMGQPFWQHESVRSLGEIGVATPADCRIYIEANPVSAGLAATPEAWPWSSATKAS